MAEQPTFGQRAGRAFTRFLVTLLVVALLGAVAYLLSKLNARTFTLTVEDDKLVVLKGRPLPIGAEPFRPADPFLADAYGPIPLEGMAVGPALLDERFTERDELDRALFEVLEKLAKPRVESDEPQVLDKGLYYLRRAERLSGLTDEQRRSLKAMEAEVAFYQARTKLEDARKQVAEALAQLKLAAESQSRHARSANQMLTEVEPQAKALEESLRKAVHTLSAPATSTPPPPAEPPKGPDAKEPGQTPAAPQGTGTPAQPAAPQSAPSGTAPAGAPAQPPAPQP